MFSFTDKAPDFYIQLKGANAGRPMLSPCVNAIGVKADPEIFEPRYLYYCFLHVYNTGIYAGLLRGSVIPFIRLGDITTAFVNVMAVQGVRS
jgi:hypothetical protein